RATAASSAMIRITTTSSSRVKPCSLCMSASSPGGGGQFPHGQEHAQGQHQHHAAHGGDENGFDGVGQALEVVVDLLLVEVGHLDEQLVEGAGLLAHRQHLHHQR